MYCATKRLAGFGRLKLPTLLRILPHAPIVLRRCYATTLLDLPALDRAWRQRWSDHRQREQQQLGPSHEQNGDGAQTADHMYILSMFPYPSGKLHLGHLRVYTIADVVARYHRLKGRNVLLPMGWDAFGLPAENAAIERGIDPAEWTRDNIARMKEQLELMNGTFDWSKEFATCDPTFYKHTQKLFLLLHRLGLVTRQRAVVNWDPVDKTVLANEQVDSEGRSWRSGAKVEQRPLEQWFFRITEFKEALLRDLDELAKENHWPERVVTMQKHWLGHTTGARYRFPLTVAGVNMMRYRYFDDLEIYTTRPETIFGVQFMGISPNSNLAKYLARFDPELREYLSTLSDSPEHNMQGYRIPYMRAHNPLNLLEIESWSKMTPLPVYIAPYVRGDYETGAIMGVPAHDGRDFAFWKRNSSSGEVKYAVTPHSNGTPPEIDGPYLEPGYMTELAGGQYRQKPSHEAVQPLVAQIQSKTELAHPRFKWKLRDWLISRQRYWGTPIPIIHCESCGPQPVPDDQLPVELPKIDHHWAGGLSGNPLESAIDWLNTSCPKCHGPAKRDTDTMDTFVDSSWYYMRFTDPHNKDDPISEVAARTRLPVDIYVGGVEHAILHLLYARFFYKAIMGELYPKKGDIAGSVVEPPHESSHEPFKRLITQGMVHGKTYLDPDSGRFLKPDEIDLSNPSEPKLIASGKPPVITYEKMSKSKHNGVDPTTFILKHGADATRAHILFQAPVSEVLNWDDDKIAGVLRWLQRVYDHVHKIAPAASDIGGNSKSFSGLEHFSKPENELNAMNEEQSTQWEDSKSVWRAVQDSIPSVTAAYDKIYPLNTAVSTLMILTNVILNNPGASQPVRLAATAELIRLMAPIAPAFAEECWSILRPDEGMLFTEGAGAQWPVPDGSLPLLKVSSMQCVVSINGKKRLVVDIPVKPTHISDGAELEAWVTEEILRSPEAQERLSTPENDIRKATKVFAVKGGGRVNYLIPKA
ncbi:hypothetical protein F4777DRAFT_538025 [Nemania sp. FL0916]|nr:hypothetical protein F4777DRAFT_538025 [Nemania sp. FL0916]